MIPQRQDFGGLLPRSALLLAVAGSLASWPAYALDGQDEGAALAAVPAAPVAAAEAPAAAAQQPVLIPDLAGIRIIDNNLKLMVLGATAPGVTIESLPILDDPALRGQLVTFLGKPLTQAELQAIANVLTRWYNSKGLPYAQVNFPAQQNLRTGVLQVVVTENPTILPNLAGIRLISKISELQAKGATTSGLAIVSLPMLEERTFRATMQGYIGKPLRQSSLLALEQAIVTFYGSRDRPYVDVAVPAGQDITGGVIQLVITESHAGKIAVAKNRWFSSASIADQLGIKTGDPISAELLREDADWLDQNPFHHQDTTPETLANGTYHVIIQTERSSTPGFTDITANVPDQFPLKGSVTYDNTGPPALTRDRWTLGLDWGNALWSDHQFSYRFSASDDFWQGNFGNPSFASHFVSYGIPLPMHSRLTIFGTYSRALPQVGPDINVTGTNSQASLRYSISLPSLLGRSATGAPAFSQEVQIGYDFKSTNNNLLFGGFQIFNTTTEVDQFLLIYNAALNDRFGQTSVSNNLVFSPGNLTAGNTSALFQAQLGAPFANANYLYDHMALTRVSILPGDADWAAALGWFRTASLVTRVVWQASNSDLLPSEQMGIGGIDSVPGYEERQENGSRGIQVNAELRSPTMTPSVNLGGNNIGDRLQVGLSWNYGNVNELKVLPDTQSTFKLQSVAGALYYTVQPYLDFRLIYGQQLEKIPGEPHLGEFAHLAVTLAY